MAYNVKFLKGAAAAYTAATKDANTFYFTEDDNQLYLGEIKLSNANDLNAAIARIVVNEGHIGNVEDLSTAAKSSLVLAINELKSELAVLTGGEGADGGIADMIEAVTGDIADLATANKGNLVEAINELNDKVKITVTTDETTEGMAKSYTIKQNNITLGVIDIPKDMVVTSGEVVTLEEDEVDGYDAGEYIKLTIKDSNDVLYIAVGSLVDIYKGSGDAGIEGQKVRVTVNQKTRLIEAFLETGSVGTNEIIDKNVTAAKIADKTITNAQIANGTITNELLSDDLKTIVGGIQKAVTKVEEGENNGCLFVTNFDAVEGEQKVEVPVHGLGTAAYADANAFEAQGSVNTALENAKEYTDTALTWGTIA